MINPHFLNLEPNVFLDEIKSLLGEYGISRVSYIDKNLRCASMLIRLGQQIEIYVSKSLGHVAANFAVLHEIGHVALGELAPDPRSRHHLETEFKVNCWALNQVLFDEAVKTAARSAFELGEDSGYHYLLSFLEEK